MGEVTDPELEGFSEQAFEEPKLGEMTEEQFALRVHLKREQISLRVCPQRVGVDAGSAFQGGASRMPGVALALRPSPSDPLSSALTGRVRPRP